MKQQPNSYMLYGFVAGIVIGGFLGFAGVMLGSLDRDMTYLQLAFVLGPLAGVAIGAAFGALRGGR
jgi:NhaP-type Na+/H+ or K+/H+ antiporter